MVYSAARYPNPRRELHLGEAEPLSKLADEHRHVFLSHGRTLDLLRDPPKNRQILSHTKCHRSTLRAQSAVAAGREPRRCQPCGHSPSAGLDTLPYAAMCDVRSPLPSATGCPRCICGCDLTIDNMMGAPGRGSTIVALAGKGTRAQCGIGLLPGSLLHGGQSIADDLQRRRSRCSLS